MHRNKIIQATYNGYSHTVLRYLSIDIAEIVFCKMIKGFTYSSLFLIFVDTLPYKFKSIFISGKLASRYHLTSTFSKGIDYFKVNSFFAHIFRYFF